MVSLVSPISVVTGGAGFIGSHMVELLIKRGHHVRVIDNLTSGHERNLTHLGDASNLDVDWRDVRYVDAEDRVFQGAKFVFHFAGIGDIVPSMEQPEDYMSVNIQGTIATLEGARASGVSKFVYAASSTCYGLAATPTSEDHHIDPQYPYALSKHFGELSAFHWQRAYGLPVNSIRIFNAYGTRSRTTGAYGAVFGVFLRQKIAGKPFTVVGDGTQVRDFIYASDVARSFLAAAETHVSGEVFNVGAGNPQSINKLVELLGGEVVNIPIRPGEPDATWANISKIQSMLNWKPTVSFEEGVSRVLECLQDWRDAPLWDPDSIAEATRSWFNHLSHDQGKLGAL